jgi:hypothetical protein
MRVIIEEPRLVFEKLPGWTAQYRLVDDLVRDMEPEIEVEDEIEEE